MTEAATSAVGTVRPRGDVGLTRAVGGVRAMEIDAGRSGVRGAMLSEPDRLVYLDDVPSRIVVEFVSGSVPGLIDNDNLVPVGGGWAASRMLQLAKSALADCSESVADLVSGRLIESTRALKPGMPVRAIGVSPSGGSITRSGFDFMAAGVALRMRVDPSHGLHLNQRFLRSTMLTAIGSVRSAPRGEIQLAAAIVLAL